MIPLDQLIWQGFAVFLTLSVLSFLYKDNAFYKFAEHIVVGVSAGYFVIILYYNGLRPNLFDHLFEQNTWDPRTGELYYIIPLLLGLIMWARFSKKWSWISRYPIALYIGIATGVSIPLEMKNRVIEQVRGSVLETGFEFGKTGMLGLPSGLWDVVLVLLVVCSLIYFFFSKEHKGWFGGVAKVGIYTLMIGFGASFGYTVMARLSLFIDRVQFVKNWVELLIR
jgi:hypothetical protein